MRYVFVDFEMNPVDKKFKVEKKVCGREIIEIGAVMLNEQFEEISSFKELVKPMFNLQIYKNWEGLTGITTEMVRSAHVFNKVFEEFIMWCGDEDYEIYAWSNSDRSQIIKEMKQKKFEIDSRTEYMLTHWIDFQKIYGEIVSAEKLVSLESALSSCGIPFSGRKHDALHDARNTSLLFVESKMNDLAQLIKKINSYIESERETTTLGEMFNFSELGLVF